MFISHQIVYKRHIGLVGSTGACKQIITRILQQSMKRLSAIAGTPFSGQKPLATLRGMISKTVTNHRLLVFVAGATKYY